MKNKLTPSNDNAWKKWINSNIKLPDLIANILDSRTGIEKYERLIYNKIKIGNIDQYFLSVIRLSDWKIISWKYKLMDWSIVNFVVLNEQEWCHIIIPENKTWHSK